MLMLILKWLLFITPFITVESKFFDGTIPETFQVEIQTTYGQSTGHSHEYFTKKAGSILTWDADNKIQSIYRELNETHYEVFIIENDAVCTSSDIPKNSNYFHMNGKPLLSTGYYFNFLQNAEFIGNERYLDIDADAYLVKSANVEGLSADIKFLWSPDDGVWKFPYCPKTGCKGWTVPLLTEITEIDGDGNKIVVYNSYFNYRTEIDDPEVFQIPRGVSCTNSHNGKKFVKLSDNFEAGEETYEPYSETKDSTKQKIYYNIETNMMRIDTTLPSEDSVEIGGLRPGGEFTTISDYKSAVVYAITKENLCEVSSMNPEDLNQLNVENTTGGILSFLLMTDIDTSQFFYVGKRELRTISCDVWVTPVSPDSNTFYEIYTTDKLFLKDDGSNITEPVLVFINVTELSDKEETKVKSISYFNYNTQPSTYDVYNIAPCFKDKDKKRIQIEFEGSYLGYVNLAMNQFISAVLSTIEKETKARAIRFQEVLVDHFEMKDDTAKILFTTTLLEDPFNADKSGKDLKQPNNDDVYESLNNFINKKLFQVFFAGNPKPYQALSIRDDVIETSGLGSADSIDVMFNKMSQKEIKRGHRNINFVTRLECFERCLNNPGFNCESFTYCTSGLCVLFDQHIDESKDERLQKNTACDTYSRNYVGDYEEYDNTRTFGLPSEKDIIQVSDPEICAHTCSGKDTLDFYCEGFDFCTDGAKKTCEFRSLHALEMDPNDIVNSNLCKHYSRDYLSDFMMIEDKSTTEDERLQVTSFETSAKDCARFCTTSADVGECKAFQMCSTRNSPKARVLCMIIDTEIEASDIPLQSDGKCDYYRRQHFVPIKTVNPDQKKTSILPATSPSDGKEEKQSGSKSSKFGSGDMWGIGIGMLLTGFLIGGVSIVIIMRLKVVRS